MGVNLQAGLAADRYKGGATITDPSQDGLSELLRGILQRQAATRIFALGLTDLVDNTGGGFAGSRFTAVPGTDIVNLVVPISPAITDGEGPFRVTTSDTLPAGLLEDTDYFMSDATPGGDTDAVFLHLSQADAIAGSNIIDITSPGFGVQMIGIVAEVFTGDPLIPETNVSGTTDGFTAASLNTSLLTIWDAFATITARVNEVWNILNAGDAFEGPGTSTPGTVPAFDYVLDANTNNTDAALFETAFRAFEQMAAGMVTVTNQIHVCQAAVNLSLEPILNFEDIKQASGQILSPDFFSQSDLPVAAIQATSSPDAVSSMDRLQAENVLLLVGDLTASFVFRMNEVTQISNVHNLSHYAALSIP